MLIRIGALSEQTGISVDVLRSWERRYGLLKPERTPGGFRLYTEDDLRRVRLVRDLIASGVSAAEAAREALSGTSDAPAPPIAPPSNTPLPPASECRPALQAAFLSFDEAAIESAIDTVFARFDLDAAIREVFIPCLKELGDGWADGSISVAQEHFAVNALRGRLMGLSRGWDRGYGPRAVLACPPGEYHDVSLVLFGLALHQRGWRITFLGADTPLESLASVNEALSPQLIVLFSAQWQERLALAPELSRFKENLVIAGATGEIIAERSGLRWLRGDPVTGATAISREFGAPSGT